ncbi:MAG: ArsR/SmtB family transcription factor [Candidatus Thorarchaeota archaeon]
MTEHIDEIKKELEEARKLKEELRKELEEVRRQKVHRSRPERRFRPEEQGRGRKPPRPRKPPRAFRLPDIEVDLEAFTDSLDDMMEQIGRTIEASVKGIGDIRIPGVRVSGTKKRRRSKRRADYEKIEPERVAKIVAPLGSEERLKILDFLKTGGKSFNDIENYTGKTGSSLTHHLNPLIEAGYVVKGEVRGMYYVTVEGRLAYRLAQWLTHRVENQKMRNGRNESGSSTDADDHVDQEVTVVVEDEPPVESDSRQADRSGEARADDELDDMDWED